MNGGSVINQNNLYKDRLRTWELEQRILQQETTLEKIQQKIEQLFQKQTLSWELAKENYQAWFVWQRKQGRE